MSSEQYARDIIEQLQQVGQLIHHYKEQVQQEMNDLSEYDKFDQDALHFLEHVHLNAPESAKLMKRWSQMRVQRRIAKDNIYLAQELQPKFDMLVQLIESLALRSPQRKYTIRTADMLEIAQPFLDKKRLDASVFRVPVTLEETAEAVCTSSHPVQVHLGKSGWELKKDDEIIFKNKKLSVVVDEIFQHAYVIQVDKAYKKVVDALLEKKKEEAATL